MRRLWDDRPPVDADRDAVPIFGADPAWSPKREWITPKSPEAKGKPCRLCRGDGAPRATPPIPPIIEAGSCLVCARCMRYGRWVGRKQPIHVKAG